MFGWIFGALLLNIIALRGALCRLCHYTRILPMSISMFKFLIFSGLAPVVENTARTPFTRASN